MAVRTDAKTVVYKWEVVVVSSQGMRKWCKGMRCKELRELMVRGLKHGTFKEWEQVACKFQLTTPGAQEICKQASIRHASAPCMMIWAN